MLKEFKEFAMKGNVTDLAIGVVIGAAFGKIVNSLVADIIMPLLGLIIGGVNFTDLKVVLRQSADPEKILTLNYGQFIQNIFDFLIIAFSIFIVIRLINKFKRKEEVQEEIKEELPTNEEVLLTQIRDLLSKDATKEIL
ncbi:large-conductance mechanosensitive channel protein MscL [Clostridium algidicarnis]|uniref:large-conductance mechanosensitive channel protein MscL n=1 Tax=Clostridium algidicarnis TaxID=37659 RepID=UPI001C0DFB80|nr:large-conductance mechanosensitive channel protein MscL [Clostridium algidicarnis]MBU3195281.1 large-conductance mechanosensitive channel protein MscL [Clostridium algidicarnis]MBU3208240.1 large-conductance mechanosensitive channel protein MscL [Clostridium algidicarnis]MBU3227528.1 large-conductance mechanosensitive channel protein MscL [Clostridium algidicarnis]MBU3251065.1 large-conductance mechanosensitive channel protein MscL [Clostridium algidicarnis]